MDQNIYGPISWHEGQNLLAKGFWRWLHRQVRIIIFWLHHEGFFKRLLPPTSWQCGSNKTKNDFVMFCDICWHAKSTSIFRRKLQKSNKWALVIWNHDFFADRWGQIYQSFQHNYIHSSVIDLECWLLFLYISHWIQLYDGVKRFHILQLTRYVKCIQLFLWYHSQHRHRNWWKYHNQAHFCHQGGHIRRAGDLWDKEMQGDGGRWGPEELCDRSRRQSC